MIKTGLYEIDSSWLYVYPNEKRVRVEPIGKLSKGNKVYILSIPEKINKRSFSVIKLLTENGIGYIRLFLSGDESQIEKLYMKRI